MVYFLIPLFRRDLRCMLSPLSCMTIQAHRLDFGVHQSYFLKSFAIIVRSSRFGDMPVLKFITGTDLQDGLDCPEKRRDQNSESFLDMTSFNSFISSGV